MFEPQNIAKNLPLSVGAAKLEAVALPEGALIAPFKGRMMAVADVLKAEIGMILPPAGQWGKSEKAMAYWRGPGQWLVFGALDARKLEGVAAVADMSDAFVRLRLTGGAEALARLVAVDVDTMRAGQVAHMAVADIPASLIVLAGGVELMIPRSYCQSAVARIEAAMQTTAAYRRLCPSG